MSEELLRDLTSYKSYRNKSVMMAARSLIHLYRDINPHMLHRKDRVGVACGVGVVCEADKFLFCCFCLFLYLFCFCLFVWVF